MVRPSSFVFHPSSSVLSPQPSRSRELRGFSLVEMLVVIGVIALLLSVVLLMGQAALSDARVKDTRVMLAQLDNAVRVFADDNPYKSIKEAMERYGPYPPDDLMALTVAPQHGDPLVDVGIPNLMPGGLGTYWNENIDMLGLTDNVSDQDNYVPYGDIKALVWSLRSNPASRVIYDAIPDRFRVTVGDDEFFDMNESDSFDTLVDKEVQYLVDGWGNPLGYYAARGVANQETIDNATSHGWVSYQLVAANKNLPVLVSYGLDGDLQLKSEQSLEEQYDAASPGDRLFENIIFNEDNLYLDEVLKDKMVEIVK